MIIDNRLCEGWRTAHLVPMTNFAFISTLFFSSQFAHFILVFFVLQNHCASIHLARLSYAKQPETMRRPTMTCQYRRVNRFSFRSLASIMTRPSTRIRRHSSPSDSRRKRCSDAWPAHFCPSATGPGIAWGCALPTSRCASHWPNCCNSSSLACASARFSRCDMHRGRLCCPRPKAFGCASTRLSENCANALSSRTNARMKSAQLIAVVLLPAPAGLARKGIVYCTTPT